eukprot:Plantae.Rhodophyta-Purpureofilum_apyrenoidigerum.ctg20772.p1 GENE.Plantae.Rhodophyta-Purpureofilum_apyrenoidigerum.ctg20772~~Plantae.Rhodophyta-Purpureofilum_apyrenoidigerum.ctg20772.p1  ORF type:complete len:842 (-),score=151.41 Plantae.Rhodophyta-Purpureofilum_apyrenoidigerum.ctg20772:243-2768(-)
MRVRSDKVREVRQESEAVGCSFGQLCGVRQGAEGTYAREAKPTPMGNSQSQTNTSGPRSGGRKLNIRRPFGRANSQRTNRSSEEVVSQNEGANFGKDNDQVASAEIQQQYSGSGVQEVVEPASQDDGDSEAGLGLEILDFINVHRKDYVGRIELLKGWAHKLATKDETDLLIVYLSKRGNYKGRGDSAMASINRVGINLEELERQTKPQPSYRRHYHCWLSRPIAKPRPKGFEYKRLLVYEDPGEELTQDDRIVLDVMKCLTTVIGGDIQIRSVMLPLSGALLSPQLRKHLIIATVQICYAWMMMGLPLKTVRILLPQIETDKLGKDLSAFKHTKKTLTEESVFQVETRYDVFFSYSTAEMDAASQMIQYLRNKNPNIRLYDCEPVNNGNLRERGVVSNRVMEAINQSKVFLALLSDDYFSNILCTENFSLAYCRDFDTQGNFIIPLFWKSCDLTPLARRLVATEGIDSREGDFNVARDLLNEILMAVSAPGTSTSDLDHLHEDRSIKAEIGAPRNPTLAEKLLDQKREDEPGNQHDQLFDRADTRANVTQIFDQDWLDRWALDFRQLVFGARIGAGGFGEVYKAKYRDQMVAVKTLQRIEDEDPQTVIAEFMVEMKLMSKLRHANIVSFLGACVDPPNFAILLEFMPGGSLYRAIHRRRRNNMGPFSLLKTAWIAYGIAKGMEYLHAQFPVIIHRDLKSPNVLLGTNVHEVKVTDFGLSRLLVETHCNTGPGGTPEWMAPELLRQDRFDGQSDVFSFGVILWELVMCEKPWRNDHPMQIVFKVGSRGEKLQVPHDVECIPEFEDMIQRCFQDDPTRRPKFQVLTAELGALCRRIEANRNT